MSQKYYKDKVKQFLIVSAIGSFLLLIFIFLCYFQLGAGQGLLTPSAILLGALYIKRKPFYGPLLGRGSNRSRISLFGYPPQNLSADGKLLLEQYAEQKKNVWRMTLPLLVGSVILIIIAFFTAGFYTNPTTSEPIFGFAGSRIPPELFNFMMDIYFIFLAIFAFFGTYYWNGFFFTLNIIRNWDKLFKNK